MSELLQNKIGLVLEGGGMRGGYTAGVLDCFLDYGISFPYCIGVSAGACNALSYISKQRGRYIRANTLHLKDKRYMGLYSLFRTGYLFGNRFVFDELTFHLEPLDFDAFQKHVSATPLTVVTTDCDTGRPRYDRITSLFKQRMLVEASSSLPLISPMITYHGKKLMDGGIADSIPIDRAISDGCNKIVVVLTQASGYQKKSDSLLPLLSAVYHEYPFLVSAFENRHILYNMTLKRLTKMEKEGKAFLLRPETPISIGRMERNPEKIRKLYQEAFGQTRKRIPELRKFIGSSKPSGSCTEALHY